MKKETQVDGLNKTTFVKEELENGGEVGIILDGRGRQPFNLSKTKEERIQNLSRWSKETNEYPELEVA